VKSVPGCLVLIVPRLMGDPVAALPGVGPHDEVSVLAPPELVVDEPPPLEAVVCAPPPLLLELLLLLLPHPASTSTAPHAAIRAIHLSHTRSRPPISPPRCSDDDGPRGIVVVHAIVRNPENNPHLAHINA
jgi:hypothetical protein